MDSKSFEIFNMVTKGFSNTLSLMPLLRQLYDQVEKLEDEEIEQLKKLYPKFSEILLKIKDLIS